MAGMRLGVSRFELLSDERWVLTEDLVPVRTGERGRLCWIIYRYRCGVACRDAPAGGAISVDSTSARAHQHTNITRRARGSNNTDLRSEPLDHALGGSRGGWRIEMHDLVEGRGRPLVTLVGSGQAGDARMFP
ncbi:hypothetical protein [Amycolatopsis sp. FDAARGOS 1241]|uniref:hypothetical protein n=1 Tax=Amycolatopsis sp. FDAARGOS 1241 TaxID=2778070 RepID=UPI00195011E0|nr:hypothetical protein [Amycolatopsis sp. FDAARGOS 1241]QRP47156.1 hypothetical protein I6J71_03815 [Amycolatopsis sp. FDAARGOS 1241]